MVTKKTTAQKALTVKPAKKTTLVAARTEVMLPHQHALSSNSQNAVGILSWSKFAGEASLQELCNDLDEQAGKVQAGDMQPIEGMLYRQAKTLETIFISLARRAAGNDGLKQFQVNLTLALKAQAQCRTTLEALAEIKNPRPLSFVKQANIAHGPQQVNMNAQASPPTEVFSSEQNKLLEVDHGQRMVIGAQGQAGRVNQTVAAMG